MLRVCLRVDDYGWSTEEIPGAGPLKQSDVGLELAQRFHAALQGLPYLGAVIPASIDDAGRGWLLSAPAGLTVAQHGTTHALSHHGVAHEYHDCETLSDVRHRIAEGRRMLGVPGVTHFVPPFNAVGAELPEALYLEGHRVLWGAPSEWPTPPQPYSRGRMLFVPAWLPLYGATRWRMRAEDRPLLDVWPEVRSLPGRACLTLHLPWEAAHDAERFDGVRRLVALLGEHVISPQEYLANV